MKYYDLMQLKNKYIDKMPMKNYKRIPPGAIGVYNGPDHKYFVFNKKPRREYVFIFC